MQAASLRSAPVRGFALSALSLLLIMSGCERPSVPTDPASPPEGYVVPGLVLHSLSDTTLSGFQVHYEGRTFNGTSTTFAYTVTGPGVDMHFRLGYPSDPCSSPPVSWSPANGATSNNDCCINPGLEWHPEVGPDPMNTFSFSYTFTGDVNEGIVAVSVKSGSLVEVGSITGPSSLYIISGSLFQDADEDAELDSLETPIPNVTVQLLQSEVVIATDLSDASGMFEFMVPCGTYTVEVDTNTLTNTQSKYFIPTTSIANTVVVGPNSTGNNFGFRTNTDKLLFDLTEGTLPTTGFNVTFWKKQLQFALSGRTAKYTRAELLSFIDTIEGLALADPYVFPADENGRLQTAYDILKGPVHGDLEKLHRELLALEFNHASLNGIDLSTQLVLIGWGESLVAGAGGGLSSPRGKPGLHYQSADPISTALTIFEEIDKSTGGGGTRG